MNPKRPDRSAAEPAAWRAVPRGVWALGLVSLLMDLSSEMIHSLLPVFLVSALGVSVAAVGLLEGVAEAAVLAVKMLSGALSDWLGRRKGLALVGYGLGALSKPLFPLAGSFATVVAARLIDRVGKGIRGAPRDALVTELTPARLRGAAFGLRQSLDTVGAVLGPLVAMIGMLASGGSFRLVFWVAVAPALACVAVLALLVKEPADRPAPPELRPRLRWRELRLFPRAFWWVAAIGGLLTLARFSEAFLILRARDLGFGLDYVPLVMVAMNLVYAASAYPAGALSDRLDRTRLLALGTVVLIAADLAMAWAGSALGLMAGVVLWGLHMGLSQGLLAALVADAAPRSRRGTAFGLFNLIGGIALLAASALAGALWDRFGAAAAFEAGAGFAALALAGLVLARRFRESGAGA